MDTVAGGLVAAFAVFAVADWVAIRRGDTRRRPLTKTAATATLVVFAAWAGNMAGDARVALVAAVVLCLAGDVALLGDEPVGSLRATGAPAEGAATDGVRGRGTPTTGFLAGLGSFAAGHAAYAMTALLAGVSWPRLAWAFPFLAAVLAFQAVTRMLPGARRAGGMPMMIAVAGYSLVISAMVVTATGASWAAAAGAMLFATSDSIIGYNRFVKPVRNADLPVMVTYHAGQLLLIVGLIAAA